MARDLGGHRGAQLLAAFAALPACLAIGSMMQYVSFDYLAWVLVSFCIVRLLRTEDPRLWLGVGASIGFGMLSKYAMPFFVAGVVVGVLVTPERRYLRSRWLWLGVGVSVANPQRLRLPRFRAPSGRKSLVRPMRTSRAWM
jgi:4-amino-4-deoxy-L-arabinose transferase-like glycosyltransferase